MLLRLNWQLGRNNTGYKKLQLLSSKIFKMDMYLLQFPEGSYTDSHRDESPLEGHQHHRVNIVLKEAVRGGKFVIKGMSQEGRIHKFRPDSFSHKVTKIKEGTRYVLSIGWLKAEL